MADILKVAEQLNSEVTRYNNERSKLEGMLESAKTNYEKAVKAYELKYGVKLTEDTLQSEYNEVFAKTKGAMLDLQEKIESIKRGDYKKNTNTVEYDLDPNVEPIREAKAAPVEEVIETPKNIVEAEDIDSSNNIKDVTTPVESSEPKVAEGPLNLNLGFEGFGDTVAVEVPKEEKKKEATKTTKRGRGSKKTLSGAELSAAVKESEKIVQNPVTFPDAEEDSDEVDLSTLGISQEKPFGEKPFGVVDTPVEKKEEEFNFGDFSDLGFGGFDNKDKQVEGKPAEVETPKVETPKVETPKVETPKEDSSFGGLGDFGDFGDFNGFDGFNLNTESKEDKKEDKEDAPISPEGWGSDFNFDASSFENILNAGNVKFGQ